MHMLRFLVSYRITIIARPVPFFALRVASGWGGHGSYLPTPSHSPTDIILKKSSTPLSILELCSRPQFSLLQIFSIWDVFWRRFQTCTHVHARTHTRIMWLCFRPHSRSFAFILKIIHRNGVHFCSPLFFFGTRIANLNGRHMFGTINHKMSNWNYKLIQIIERLAVHLGKEGSTLSHHQPPNRRTYEFLVFLIS